MNVPPELGKALQAAHAQNFLGAVLPPSSSHFLQTDEVDSVASDDDCPPAELFAGSGDEFDASSELSGYESSETESLDSDREIFAGKRKREPESRRDAEAPGASKAQKRDGDKLPRKREPVKPVLHPLSAEEKLKRKAERECNREINRETNLVIIRALLKDVQQDIAAHRNLKHFRTDLHHHIDKILLHNREKKKVVRPPRVEKAVPPGASLAVDVSASSDALPKPSESRYLHFEIESESGTSSKERLDAPPFSLRTEIHAEIEGVRMKIQLDSGATFSGISRETVDRCVALQVR